ncbi:hypothetical protein ACFV9G_29930, partial [Nocardioides sp. NPDC059952]|uniref:hypothetical protein n=1 Tax=Nocardioides sp. NPDC059952 TaxID=3347014 RepID=UPI00365A9394
AWRAGRARRTRPSRLALRTARPSRARDRHRHQGACGQIVYRSRRVRRGRRPPACFDLRAQHPHIRRQRGHGVPAQVRLCGEVIRPAVSRVDAEPHEDYRTRQHE